MIMVRVSNMLLGALICFVASTDAGIARDKRLILGGGQDMVRINYTNSDLSHHFGGSFSKALKTCDNCVCGISRQTRIVNGEVTDTYEFPWAVAITYQGLHHCGASIITSRHLLTAAHCINGFQKAHFGLRFPDNGKYRIKNLIMHEKYDKRSFNNDIAIIELDRAMTFDGALKSVCLPDAVGFRYIGATGVAIGWGRIGEGEPVSEELRKVDVPIMSVEECNKSQYPENRMTDNMFCAGYLDGERDSCNGDSGGALQVRSESGAMEIVGIVSFGRGCARPYFPGVYTKVTNYLDWINKNLKGECVCSQPETH